MGITNLNVVLDNVPANGYPPGATVTGRVIIAANKPDHIRSLNLKVNGEAEVSFTDFVTTRRRRFRRINRIDNNTYPTSGCDMEEVTSTEVERFTGHEQYFSTSYQILGETDVQAGEQEFLFTTVLPPVLPSTFVGRFGFIRYTLKIKLDRAWNFDQVAKVEFKVAAPKDLNTSQSAMVLNDTIHSIADSVIYRGMKHFNCLCCRSGPFSMAVELSKSGLTPGETLRLAIELDNTTKISISSVNIILRQTTFWSARNPRSNSKRTDEALLVLTSAGVSPRNSRSWYQTIIIPAIPFINIDVCSIIKLQHSIIIEAVPDGIHKKLVVEAPIIIGTIPIGATVMTDFGMPNNVFAAQLQPSAPIDYGFNQPEPPPPYPISSAPYPPAEPPFKKY